MKNFLIIIGIISTMSCMAVTFDTIPANHDSIEYTGRIDFSNPLAPRFSYSGVSVRACFSGTSIAVIMDDNIGRNFYNIILDGKLLDTINISVGKKKYMLSEGLDSIKHVIEIFKRTEQEFGKTQFFGFVVDKGTTLHTIADNRDKLIEYIGNSITCGYGNEGSNGGTFGPTTENHYLTFAAITSRNFNARHLAVCKSGIGVYRNYDGPAAGNTDCMTNYYTRTFLYDENPKYSFEDKPDLVCIDLGTNDFSTTGADSTKFVNNYFRLIDTIQTKYSMPDIVCLVGPMLSGTSLTKIRNYLNFIADSASNKGKGNVYFFEMSAQTGDLGIAIDYHPTVAQHKRNALELTNFIKTLKNWKITPLIYSTNINEASNIKIEFNTPVQEDVNNFSGFEVYKDNQPVIINSIYLDSSDNRFIHIVPQQPFNVGDQINLSYTPGTIKSTDSLLVGAANYLSVKNNLTVTKIIKGATNTNGTTVILSFNKNLQRNSTIEGLTITDHRGIVAIDSFKIINAQLSLYLNDNLIKDDSVFATYNGANINGMDEIPLSSFQKYVIKNSSKVTGISINKQDHIDIYPNPNNTGKVYYHLDKFASFKTARLEIYNTNGSLLYTQKISESAGLIELDLKITKGVYIFKFILEDSIMTKSVIIE
jgi:hypothetical protein